MSISGVRLHTTVYMYMLCMYIHVPCTSPTDTNGDRNLDPMELEALFRNEVWLCVCVCGVFALLPLCMCVTIDLVPLLPPSPPPPLLPPSLTR